MDTARPRPKIVDKQRPEVKVNSKEKGPKNSDHNLNLGVPAKLRQGSGEAMSDLARRNAAMGGL